MCIVDKTIEPYELMVSKRYFTYYRKFGIRLRICVEWYEDIWLLNASVDDTKIKTRVGLVSLLDCMSARCPAQRPMQHLYGTRKNGIPYCIRTTKLCD